jgi:hypothetical protein
MEIHVSDAARAATTQCKNDFCCLKGKIENLCPVENCIGGEVHFIKCQKTGGCSYCCSFGYEHFCACPVRKEIFNKYEI